MVYFIKNSEINMDFYFTQMYKRLLLLKLCDEKFCLLDNLKIFFIFRNIMIVSGLFIFNYILFVWLTTGLLLKVKGYDNVFQRGVYYYRFMLLLKTDYFLMLDFFINYFFNFLKKEDVVICIDNKDRLLFKIKNYEVFSNMRLSSYLYLYELEDPLYLDLNFNNYKDLFLSLLKLNFFLKKCING